MMKTISELIPRSWRTTGIPLVLLSVIVWATFGQLARNELTFDDLDTIKNNQAITTLRNLPLLFSPQYFQRFDEFSYRPVCTLSYFLDHAIAGKRPWIYHLHNVAFHHLNVLLVFALFHLLGAGLWRSFATALIFAVHPLQTEAVIFPGFREDLQMTAGMLVMSCCLVSDRRGSGAGWVIGATMALGYGLFAKEGALVLPAAWWIGDLLYGRTAVHRLGLCRRYILLVLVLLFYVLIRFAVMANPAAAGMEVIEPSPLGQRLLTAPYLFAYYLRRFLWPLPLCIIAGLGPLKSAGPIFYLSLLVCAAFVVLWVMLARREPWLWLAGLWVGATFLPVSNIYPIINLWAERFYYSVGVGMAAIAVAAIVALWERLTEDVEETRRLGLAIGGWILIGFLAWGAAILDVGRILQCRTSLSLWRETVRVVPTNGLALGTLAKYELDAGNYDHVERLAPALERYDPWIFRANLILGENASRQGRWEEAIKYYEKARSVPPASPQLGTSVTLGLAKGYQMIGQRERAVTILRQALQQNPGSLPIQNLLHQFETKPAAAPTTTSAVIQPAETKPSAAPTTVPASTQRAP